MVLNLSWGSAGSKDPPIASQEACFSLAPGPHCTQPWSCRSVPYLHVAMQRWQQTRGCNNMKKYMSISVPVKGGCVSKENGNQHHCQSSPLPSLQTFWAPPVTQSQKTEENDIKNNAWRRCVLSRICIYIDTYYMCIYIYMWVCMYVCMHACYIYYIYCNIYNYI